MGQPAQPLSLEQRAKELKTQLKYANAEAQLFEAMLNVVRKDTGSNCQRSFQASRVEMSKQLERRSSGLAVSWVSAAKRTTNKSKPHLQSRCVVAGG